MRRPRFSIAGIMALTALIALDGFATRAVFPSVYDMRSALLYVGALPWLNVLLIGLVLLRGRWRRGEPVAFLVGFEVVGWAVLLGIVAVTFACTTAFAVVVDAVANTLMAPVQMVPPEAGVIVFYGVLMAILMLPQLAAALVGGLLNRRYRVRIERRDRAGDLAAPLRP